MKITVFKNGRAREAQPAELPQLLASPDETLWADIIDCDDEEAGILRDTFHFHPVAIEDTRNHRQRPKLEEYEGYLFLIVNTVVISGLEEGIEDIPGLQTHHDLNFREVDLFIGQNYVVTVHSARDTAIDRVQRRINNMGSSVQLTAGYLAYVLLDVVIDEYFPVMDMFEEEISALEDTILLRPRQEQINRLFELKHMLLHLWRVVWPERDMLGNLAQPHIYKIAGLDTNQYYIRDVADHLLWIADMINTYRDTLTSMIDLYMSSVSNRLNQVVNRLTVLTLIIGVMTVVSGFYGMNFEKTWPPFGSPLGVPFVILLMGVGMAGIFAYARYINRDKG
ncbi:MAG: magnesium/cobalt transporter CorA [Anaerolineae bacterium]